MTSTVRLVDVCSKIGSGATPRGGKSSYLDTGPVSLVRSQNIHNSGFSKTGLAFISEEQAERLSNVAVEPDDVLLNITGDSVARVCQVENDILPARVNQHVAIIRPDPEKLDPRFLRYFLVQASFQEFLLSMASVGATRNALTKGMIEEFEIPYVDIFKQREIAAVLRALDDKIELNRKTAATLEEMARALYRSWFVDFDPVRAKTEGRSPAHMDPETAALFPDSFGVDGLPVGWELAEIEKELIILDSKRVPLSKSQRAGKRGEIPYYGATSVMDYVDEAIFDEELLLLGEDGSVVGPDGKPFLQYIWGPAWVNNHAHVLKGSRFSVAQLWCIFDQVDISPFVNGAVQAKLNQGNLKKVPFVRTSPQVHVAFDRNVTSWFDQIRVTADQNQTLATLRDTLLPRLMSGDLRVGEAREQMEGIV